MDGDNCELATGFVSRTYIEQGSQALATRRRLIKTLLSQRKLPQAGWDEATIEMFFKVRRRLGGSATRGPYRPAAAAAAARRRTDARTPLPCFTLHRTRR